MVRVRIGPSPTGDPHVGTAYIALFNQVFAKKHGGTFVLRVEDTDRTRSKPEWESMLVDALRWLGITWDEGPDVGGPYGPYRQSERGDIYRQHTQMLVDKGAAYRCFCTSERLAELRDRQRQEKAAFQGYDGHCLTLSPQDVAAKLANEVPHVVRLMVPKGETTVVKDLLRGEVSFENQQIDDQVLLKSDGMPTYHLANVVDDHLMKITHVIRAEEWITSTPKHVLLYRAFGWEEPTWVHMPLLRNQDRSKISKRKNPVSLNYYRDAGIKPEALLNYLGMMGWTMPNGEEKFTVAEMVEAFTFDRISLGGPVFDPAKLTWLNGLYLREAGPEAMVEELRKHILSDEALAKVAPLVVERIDKLEDFMAYAGFFFVGDVEYDEAARKELVPKKRTPKDTRKALERVVEMIDALPELRAEVLEEGLRKICEEIDWKAKDLFMPVRVAVTGRKATPGLFETMEVLGKEKCRRRLRKAIEVVKQA